MSGHYISADVGGTFTDLVLYDPVAGRVLFEKTLSTPGRADGVIDGLEKITVSAGLSAHTLERFVHGFTIATNAYLTRTGARVVLLVTDGFGDVLEIREQLRPHLKSGNERVKELEKVVMEEEDTDQRVFYEQRVKKLERWLKQGKLILPLMQRVLGE